MCCADEVSWRLQGPWGSGCSSSLLLGRVGCYDNMELVGVGTVAGLQKSLASVKRGSGRGFVNNRYALSAVPAHARRSVVHVEHGQPVRTRCFQPMTPPPVVPCVGCGGTGRWTASGVVVRVLPELSKSLYRTVCSSRGRLRIVESLRLCPDSRELHGEEAKICTVGEQPAIPLA